VAANPLEVRIARLEGGYEQINERLGTIEGRLGQLEQRLDRVASEIRGGIAGLGREIGDLRKQMNTQFYWVVGLILVSILIPLMQRYGP
jgi:tetrahydromethanopterin S-methyltransferase subunit G